MSIQQVLSQLPADLSPLIKSFLFRPDWRTCRKHESDLVSGYNKWTKRVLDDDALDWYYPGIKSIFPIIFNQKELDVYMEWTMFGRWWIILMTRKNQYWNLGREVFFERERDIEYQRWYLWEFFWHHNEWRRNLR